MNFKKWFNEGFNTDRIGLYPPIADMLGQVPPLYAAARSPDLITYFDIAYGKNRLDSKNGLVHYHDQDPRIKKHAKVNKN